MVTHLPYNCACPYCIAGKKYNLQHRRAATRRTLPHIVADYCYLKDSTSYTTLTVLVILILPPRAYFATVVDTKGPATDIVKRLGRLIKECGLTHYTYRSDREAALRAVLRSAALDAGIPADKVEDLSNTKNPDDAEPITGVAVPEESSPGESKSNARQKGRSD